MTDPLDVTKKAIWIDLDNSPHVPLFAPIINHYRSSGVDVIVTARDHAQTLELLKLAGLDDNLAVIGCHYGKNKLNKVRGLLVRAIQLSSHIKRIRRDHTQISVAISHGSRAMVLAAKWLKIPIVTMYDYEFTETTIFNRLSDRVLVPEKIPDKVLDGIGLAASKRVKYPGIKEELYVRAFRPVPIFLQDFCEKHGVADLTDKVFVVLRPPATTANYHSKESGALLDAILRHLVNVPDAFTVILPRTRGQASELREMIAMAAPSADNFHVLDTAADGLNLAYASDLLISGGGTMNREAALLGVPVYSIFAGKQGSLDSRMEKEGMITFIRNEQDIAKINLKKRKRDDTAEYSNVLTERVERFVIEQINSFLEKG